jgi:hypothetical protein
VPPEPEPTPEPVQPTPDPSPPVPPEPEPPATDPPEVVLDGGIATLAGAAHGYALTMSGGEIDVVPHDGSDGTAIPLAQATALRFTDGGPLDGDTVDLGAFLGVRDISEKELSTFVEMYVAYFDRAPDALGLAFWGTALAGGLEVEAIAEDFFRQPETLAAFPDPDNSAALVDSAYRNLLERDPDAAGRAFWINELENETVSRGNFMLSLIDGARANPDSADDVRTIEAKADIGLAYAALHGLTDADNASAVMELYDRENHDRSMMEASAMIEAYADEARSPADGTEFLFRFDGLVDDPFALF